MQKAFYGVLKQFGLDGNLKIIYFQLQFVEIYIWLVWEVFHGHILFSDLYLKLDLVPVKIYISKHCSPEELVHYAEVQDTDKICEKALFDISQFWMTSWEGECSADRMQWWGISVLAIIRWHCPQTVKTE